MEKEFSKERAEEEINKGKEKAKKIFDDDNRFSDLLKKLETRLKNENLLSDVREYILLLIRLIKDFRNKQYTDIPIGSIIAVVSALVYFVSPIDLIPDVIPGVGYVDDAAVILACIGLIKNDLDAYKKWLEENESTNESE